MKLSAYIYDGYTRQAFLKSVPGLYPDIHFQYRPCTAAQAEVVLGKTRRESDDNSNATFMAQVISKHILDWDIEGNNGKLPIKPETIRCLQSQVFQRMFSIVLGLAAGDLKEGEKTDSSDDEMDYNAIFESTNREQQEVKN